LIDFCCVDEKFHSCGPCLDWPKVGSALAYVVFL